MSKLQKSKLILAAGLIFGFIQIAPAFASILILSAPKEATPGDLVTVTIKTHPKADCQLEAQGEGLGQMLALRPMAANSSGKVTWTFELPRKYYADKLPLFFTSKFNGKEEKLVSVIDIRSDKAFAARPTLELVSAPFAVAPGHKVTIRVHSTPNAALKIEAQGAGVSQAMALGDLKANARGTASWTFAVAKGYKANCMPIAITADFNGVQKKLVTSIDVGNHMASRSLPKIY